MGREFLIPYPFQLSSCLDLHPKVKGESNYLHPMKPTLSQQQNSKQQRRKIRKAQRQLRRDRQGEFVLDLLRQNNLDCKVLCKCPWHIRTGIFDIWPSTSRYWNRVTNLYKKGLGNLLDDIAMTHIVNKQGAGLLHTREKNSALVVCYGSGLNVKRP